jgi:hypothetical protein
MALPGFPTVVDDTGGGQDGTVLDAAFFGQIESAIEGQAVSPTNPTVTPADTTDEVVEARGAMPSLDDRLDVVLNEDGTLKSQAALVTANEARSLAGINLVPNDCMICWSYGDALAPDFYALSGAGALVQRCGIGLADTQTMGYGAFCARLTYGAALARLSQDLIPAVDFVRATGLRGRKVSFGCRVKSSVANQARIVIDDGVSTSQSAYHTGGGAVEWLSVVHTMSGSASKLTIHMEVATAGSCYFGALTSLLSDLAPADWIPCLQEKENMYVFLPGIQTVGTFKTLRASPGVGIVTDVQLRAITGPVGSALKVDVKVWDGVSLFVSMFTTPVAIADGFNSAGMVPDAGYHQRCLRGFWVVGAPTVPLARSYFSVDVTQVGSGTPGSDLTVEVHVRKFLRAFEQILSYNAV